MNGAPLDLVRKCLRAADAMDADPESITDPVQFVEASAGQVLRELAEELRPLANVTRAALSTIRAYRGRQNE